MMIQLPGSTVPVQVKGILANSTIPITLSTAAGNPAPSTVVSATEPHSGRHFAFYGSFLLACRERYTCKNEGKLFSRWEVIMGVIVWVFKENHY